HFRVGGNAKLLALFEQELAINQAAQNVPPAMGNDIGGVSWVLLLRLVAQLFLFALVLGAGDDRVVHSGDDLLDYRVGSDKSRKGEKNKNRGAQKTLVHRRPCNSLVSGSGRVECTLRPGPPAHNIRCNRL